MKKIYFTFFLFIFHLSSFSQQWCAPGSVWNYKVDDNGYPNARLAYVELKVTGTDTLNGKDCYVILGEGKGINYNYWAPHLPSWPYNVGYKFYTYEDSGVIYISRGARFDTLVNFNALPGDKWLPVFLHPDCQSSEYISPLTVQDTGHVTINGLYLKKITAGYQDFIEGIGGVTWFMYNYQTCIVDVQGDGQFTCFRADNFPVYISPLHKECVNWVSVPEVNASSRLQVFPNPGSGKFNIETGNNASARVFDLTGKLILFQQLGTGSSTIHLEQCPSGIYVLEVTEPQARHVRKLTKID